MRQPYFHYIYYRKNKKKYKRPFIYHHNSNILIDIAKELYLNFSNKIIELFK